MQHDITIVGAGLIGMSAALAMAQRGYTVTLLDNHDFTCPTSPLGRVYALNDASFNLFDTLGILKYLPKIAYSTYRHMSVWMADSQAQLDFDAIEVGASHLGFIIEHDVLYQALLTHLQQNPLITCTPKTSLESIDASTHRLVMIADGGNSSLVKKLNIPITEWSYHHHALVTVVETERPHNNTAYQVFLPTGPLAFLPLVNPHQCAIVWSTSPEQAKILLESNSFEEALYQASQTRLGHIKPLGPCTTFPLHMKHVTQYVGENWLILGDAAHTIHPLAGQGLNLGLADLTTWLGYFDKNTFERLPRALKAYQRNRKYHVWKMILLLESIKRLTAHPSTPIAYLRDMGFNLSSELGVVKRFLIDQARGITT